MTVYIVDIEAVDTRYTKQWKEHLPLQLQNRTDDVVVISGGETPQATTPHSLILEALMYTNLISLSNWVDSSVTGKLVMGTISFTLMLGILLLFSYDTWLAFLAQILLSVACGMPVAMILRTFWDD